MLARSKARNRRVEVTGALLASENKFYQWLEGPPDSVDALGADIRRDARHKNVELIDHSYGPLRLFAERDMKFITREPPIAAVHDRTEGRGSAPPKLIDHAARLALKGEEDAIVGGMEELMLMGQDFLTLHGALIEPAARRLGDWRRDDRFDSRDIALAQAGAAPVTQDPLRMLIATPPGEAHILGAALVGDVFRDAGWRVTAEFPATVDALAESLGATAFDVLNLCLSDVFDRSGQIPFLTALISAARSASANPRLMVLAGGRLFKIHHDLAGAIGADGVYSGASDALTAVRCGIDPAESRGRGRSEREPQH